MIEHAWQRMSDARPRPGAAIEIDWLGTVFAARFIKVFAPWGTAWHLNVEGIAALVVAGAGARETQLLRQAEQALPERERDRDRQTSTVIRA